MKESALLVGDHFQGQLVVVAAEQRRLAGGGNGGRLFQDIHNGLAPCPGSNHSFVPFPPDTR